MNTANAQPQYSGLMIPAMAGFERDTIARFGGEAVRPADCAKGAWLVGSRTAPAPYGAPFALARVGAYRGEPAALDAVTGEVLVRGSEDIDMWELYPVHGFEAA
ncbi:MAG: hypothetical protein ACOZAQ_05140 [Pseudomonadota bacterium]